MTARQSERPYRPSRRYWRVSKYILPGDLAALAGGGPPAPRRLVTAEELAAAHPDLVHIQDLGGGTTHKALALRKIYRGELGTVVFPSPPPEPQHIHQYRECGAVGRHSAIVGPDGTLVAECGCYVSDRSPMRRLPLGRWNPALWRHCWLNDLRYRRRIPAPQRIAGTVAVLNNRWCHNFYHWLLEVLPRVEMLRRGRRDFDHVLVDCLSGYQRRALELLGVPAASLIQPHVALHLRADSFLRPTTPDSRAWQDVARTIKQNLPPQSLPYAPRPARRIYISRRLAAHRKVADEDRLERMLGGYGFECHHFETTDFARQVQLLDEAEVIVAVHGAALANLIFARPGTRVIEICPVDRYNPDCFPRVSAAMRLEHLSVGAGRSRYRQNLHVELDDVAAALDVMGVAPRGVATGRLARAA